MGPGAFTRVARWLGCLLVVAHVAVPVPASADVGIDFEGLLGPPARAPGGSVQYGALWHPEQGVDGQDAELDRLVQEGGIRATLPGGAGEWSPFLRVRHEDLDSGARHPDSGASLPDDLWDVSLGGFYRRFLGPGRFVGGSLTVSSPSDEPFHSADEVSVVANGLYRVPSRGRDAWIFLVNYSNNRDFWNHVPLPGIAYWYQPTSRVRLLLGFPALYAGLEVSGLRLRALYLYDRTVHAGAEYDLHPSVEVLAGFHMDNERYFLAGRAHEDERLFHYEKRVEGGVRVHPGWEEASLEVLVGYAFDRLYFVGENWDDRTRDRIDVAPGGYLRAGIRSTF